MKCRFCGKNLSKTFVDLGSSPPSNSYLTEKTCYEPESWYPLKVMICDSCRLVQTEDFVGADEMFSDEYAYFSSFSTTFLKHAEEFVTKVVKRFNLTSESTVVEVASNDGYLLQYVKAEGVPSCYGIEPTKSTAREAKEKGIEVVEKFFGEELAVDLAKNNRSADLTIANNVLPHVPDINDFVKGFALLLKPGGVATFEFQHLMSMMQNRQFDTIYHEHYSYLSLSTVIAIFKSHGLQVFDVEKISTHGGSLRVYAQRSDTGAFPVGAEVDNMLQSENEFGINDDTLYDGFQSSVESIKDEFLRFLLSAKKERSKIAAYGAAAKGNTLFNYAGIRPDTIRYIVDKNPAKQDKYMPGSRIPIVDELHLKEDKPDYIVIIPWNLKDEIQEQLSYIREWGGKFVIALPELIIE